MKFNILSEIKSKQFIAGISVGLILGVTIGITIYRAAAPDRYTLQALSGSAYTPKAIKMNVRTGETSETSTVW